MYKPLKQVYVDIHHILGSLAISNVILPKNKRGPYIGILFKGIFIPKLLYNPL